MKKQTVSLTLGSGGARGLAHIGAIEELLSRGYVISSVSGCSIGSLVGGAFAAGKLNELKEWMWNMDEQDLYDLFDFTYAKRGLIKGEKVMDKLYEIGLGINIEDLDIPFVAVAVDLVTHKKIVFRKGSLIDAIRGSIAIPTFFTPHVYDNMELIDGGVMDPLPMGYFTSKAKINMAISLYGNFEYIPVETSELELRKERKNYRKLLVHFLKAWVYSLPRSKQPLHKKTGILDVMDVSFSIMLSKITELTRDKFKPDIFLEISRYLSETFEFNKAREIIDHGRIMTCEALDKYEKKPKGLLKRIFGV